MNRIRELLRKIVHDEGEPLLVRRRAFEASVRFVEEWHAPLVRRIWLSAEPDWRTTAMFAMACLPGFDQEIIESVEDESLPEQIRAEAVRTAGMRGLKQLRAKIRELARDPKHPQGIRFAALAAVAEFGPPAEARSLLRKVAGNDPDEEIRQAAADYLADPDDFDTF
jgi:hypothetical protein